jgi:hypothetical protein
MPGTLTVGCRHPHGIVMRLYRKEDYDEPVMGGGFRTVKRAVPMSDRGEVKLNGSARVVGKDQPHDIRSGAGLTYGVDADFFAEWSKQFPDFTTGKTPLVFAQTKAPEANAQARDLQPVKTGFEPVNPNLLPEEFRGKIQTAAV